MPPEKKICEKNSKNLLLPPEKKICEKNSQNVEVRRSRLLHEEPQKSNHKAQVLKNSLTLCIGAENEILMIYTLQLPPSGSLLSACETMEEETSALPQCGLWNAIASPQYGIYTAFYKSVRIPDQTFFSQRDLMWVLTWILSRRAHRDRCLSWVDRDHRASSTTLICGTLG